MLAKRRVSRTQQYGSASPRRRGARMSGCPPCLWSPCPHPPSASACPVPARPVSGVRGRVRRPSVRCPPVRCPMPGVRVLRRVSIVRCERPASVLSAPVSSWSARVRRRPHALGQAGSACHPTVSATGWSAARVQAWRWKLAPAALAAAASAWTPAAVAGGAWAVAWFDRLADQGAAGFAQGSPLGRAAGACEVHPLAGGCARRSAGARCRRAPTTTWVVGRPLRQPERAERARPRRGPSRHAVC
jgi:hypothetical protein